MKFAFRAALSLCLMLGTAVAFTPLPVSAAPITAIGIFQPATIGVASSQVIPPGFATNYIYLGNPSAPGGNTVYCAFNATPTVAGAGTISLAPGQSFTLEDSQVDASALNCIASGASTPFTYGVR